MRRGHCSTSEEKGQHALVSLIPVFSQHPEAFREIAATMAETLPARVRGLACPLRVARAIEKLPRDSPLTSMERGVGEATKGGRETNATLRFSKGERMTISILIALRPLGVTRKGGPALVASPLRVWMPWHLDDLKKASGI